MADGSEWITASGEWNPYRVPANGHEGIAVFTPYTPRLKYYVNPQYIIRWREASISEVGNQKGAQT